MIASMIYQSAIIPREKVTASGGIVEPEAFRMVGRLAHPNGRASTVSIVDEGSFRAPVRRCPVYLLEMRQ